MDTVADSDPKKLRNTAHECSALRHKSRKLRSTQPLHRNGVRQSDGIMGGTWCGQLN